MRAPTTTRPEWRGCSRWRAWSRQRPLKRSVLFVAFGSEEQLMLGSYHYVAHPLRPLDTTIAVLNLDMIGRNEEHTPDSLGAYELTAAASNQLNLVGAVFSPDLQKLLAREAPAAGLALSTKFDRDSSMRALLPVRPPALPPEGCSRRLAVRRVPPGLSRTRRHRRPARLREDGARRPSHGRHGPRARGGARRSAIRPVAGASALLARVEMVPAALHCRVCK